MQRPLSKRCSTVSTVPRQLSLPACEGFDIGRPYAVFQGDCEQFLRQLPEKPLFDLVITSPPYNIGKPYEQITELETYKTKQRQIIREITKRLKVNGNICWQVGNYVVPTKGNRGGIFPLDFLFHPLFQEQGFVLRNRIIWHFGHGLHCKHRFSGRYEVVLWYTRDNEYYFDLDSVRVASKYPGKKHYKGPNAGKISSNPLGKNPEDVWDVELSQWDDFVWNIPNVKSNHVEKQDHPCQFPVGLVERFILALSPSNGLVFDPFSGVASTGVAAAIHKRRFWGCELIPEYVRIGRKRVEEALNGTAKYRPHDTPIYDHTKSPLSRLPGNT